MASAQNTPWWQDLEASLSSWIERIEAAHSLADLEALRVEAIGKKGVFTAHFKQMKDVDGEDKKAAGAALNRVKTAFMSALDARQALLSEEALVAELAADALDVTLPGRGERLGGWHPVTRIKNDCLAVLTGMGFETVSGPEVEDQYHNFTALNMPDNHPARAMHDTFYLAGVPHGDSLGEDRVLRTHTSTMQIRALAKQKPPIRMVGAGRVFRCDYDPTHTPMFHQLEGMVIDQGIHFGHLKALLIDFLKHFFGEDVPIRFRPSYFPFTEPSAEVDIQWQTPDEAPRWLEVLGCGMVHPKVLTMAGIDPEVYTGFAFGVGLDRLAMIRYGIQDLRSLFVNDLAFLKQCQGGV